MGKKPNKLFGQPSMYVCTYINKCAQILTLVLLDKEYTRVLFIILEISLSLKLFPKSFLSFITIPKSSLQIKQLS